MKSYTIRILHRLLAWLEDDALTKRAGALTRAIDTMNVSGEYKRHHVYAQLLKEFPQTRKRDVGLAIEKSLQ